MTTDYISADQPHHMGKLLQAAFIALILTALTMNFRVAPIIPAALLTLTTAIISNSLIAPPALLAWLEQENGLLSSIVMGVVWLFCLSVYHQLLIVFYHAKQPTPTNLQKDITPQAKATQDDSLLTPFFIMMTMVFVFAVSFTWYCYEHSILIPSTTENMLYAAVILCLVSGYTLSLALPRHVDDEDENAEQITTTSNTNENDDDDIIDPRNYPDSQYRNVIRPPCSETTRRYIPTGQ